MYYLWKIIRINGAYSWIKVDVNGGTRLEIFTSGKFSTFSESLEAAKGCGYAESTGSHILKFENLDCELKNTAER